MVAFSSNKKTIVASILASSLIPGEASEVSARGRFLWLSDTHYDRYYGTKHAAVHKTGAPCNTSSAPKFSAYGCGSSMALIESALEYASSIDSRPEFILFTGDAARHLASLTPNHTDTVLDALETVPRLIQSYFPDVPIVHLPPPELGNNDLPGDYSLAVNSSTPCYIGPGESLPIVTNSWLENVSKLEHLHFASDEEAAVFACGGYLLREVLPNFYIMVLNTVLWSVWHTPSSSLDDPLGQHAWMRGQLSFIRQWNGKVYITGHIPPVLQSYVKAMGSSLMQQNHVSQYLQTISDFSDVIAGQFFGHVHANELRRVPSLPDTSPPLVMIGSISPCYTTTPFFSHVLFDRKSYVPVDITTYNTYLENDGQTDSTLTWERVFDSLLVNFGMNELTNAETQKLAGRLILSDAAWDAYFNQWYQGMPFPTCDDACQRSEACIVACGFSESDYENCIQGSGDGVSCTSSTEAFFGSFSWDASFKALVGYSSIAVALCVVLL